MMIKSSRKYIAQYKKKDDEQWLLAGKNDDCEYLIEVTKAIWDDEPDIEVRYLEQETILRVVDL